MENSMPCCSCNALAEHIIASLRPNQLDSVFEPIMASMPGYIYWKDRQSHYLWCNDNLAQVSGLKSRTDIIGKTDYDFAWGQDLAAQFIADDQQVLQTGAILTTEYELPIKQEDGHNLIVRTEKRPLYDAQQNIIGILAIATDITKQKHLEREQQNTHYVMADILYNLPGLIYWKNQQSQYIGFNKNVVELSGLTREQLYGKTDLELNWGRKEAESFQRDDQEVMNTGVIKITEHEIPIKRSDDKFIIVRTEKSRLYDKNGKVAGVLGVAMDVTEQKILEEKLIAEKEKAERSDLAKTEFIRNMEHDIRTPFSGIYSIATILQGNETDPEKKQFISAITQCAKELLDYCNGILDFSRIESGNAPILQKKFDLAKLIKRVVAMEQPAAINKNLLLLTEYPEDAPKILLGDEYRVQRILINLMSNAVKFTEKGYVKLRVHLANQLNSQEVIMRFFIEDTGIGIPKEKQAYIYERFNRLTPANQGKYKGAGLGLSVVKHLIEELHGEIELSSQPKKGTIFVCTIPLKCPLIADILFEDKNSHG